MLHSKVEKNVVNSIERTEYEREDTTPIHQSSIINHLNHKQANNGKN